MRAVNFRECIYIYICIYLEPQWPLFLKVNNPPKKQGLFSNQNKGPIWGSRYKTTAQLEAMAGRPKGCGARDGLQECGHRVSGEARLGWKICTSREWGFLFKRKFSKGSFISWMFYGICYYVHLTICHDYWIHWGTYLLPTVTCFLPHRNTT